MKQSSGHSGRAHGPHRPITRRRPFFSTSKRVKGSSRNDDKATSQRQHSDSSSLFNSVQEEHRLGLEKNSGIESSYKPIAWQKMSHVKFASESIPTAETTGVRSLRELAALALANMVVSHPDDLTEFVIRQSMVNWASGWKLVWDKIAEAGLDSYSMFQRFANVFANEHGFRCHGKHVYSNVFGGTRGVDHRFLDKRTICLGDRLIVGKSNHRIELLPGLRNMSSLVLELNNKQQFKFLTLVNLSVSNGQSVQPVRQNFLDIMAIPSLVALDVSGCDSVDSTILQCWALAMKSGQWQNLRILCLNRCTRVSSSVVHDLMKISSVSLTKAFGLVYIETPGEVYLELDGAADLWTTRSDLSQRTKGQKPRFPHKKFAGGYGLAAKYMFLRTWANHASALVVDPEGYANYIRKKYLLQEFIFYYGDNNNINCIEPAHEYFRIAWPSQASEQTKAAKRAAGSQLSEPAPVKRRQKIVRRGVQVGVNGIF